MAISTFLTTWFHRRALRHFWLLIGVVGCAACLWWMSSVDNFTSKGQVALMVGCWGLFVGLFPPVFLQDEVEGLDRRDFLYGGALAIVALAVPIVIIPTMTSTIVSAWSDRALDCAAAESASKPAGSGGILGPDRRLLPTARRRRVRPVPDDVNRVGRIRQGGGRGPRHPERAAIFEPDGWGRRPFGHGPVGPRRTGKTRLSQTQSASTTVPGHAGRYC